MAASRPFSFSLYILGLCPAVKRRRRWWRLLLFNLIPRSISLFLAEEERKVGSCSLFFPSLPVRRGEASKFHTPLSFFAASRYRAYDFARRIRALFFPRPRRRCSGFFLFLSFFFPQTRRSQREERNKPGRGTPFFFLPK